MAENKDELTEVKHPIAPPAYLEVTCRSSGQIRRFSAGTEAGFAIDLINKKLANNGSDFGHVLLASHIEAVKEGEEEPVSFGPNSLLVNYGLDWKLQTVVGSYGDKREGDEPVRVRTRHGKVSSDTNSTMITEQSPMTLEYFGKILLAFILIFVFGAAFTLALENLPRFILYINSSI